MVNQEVHHVFDAENAKQRAPVLIENRDIVHNRVLTKNLDATRQRIVDVHRDHQPRIHILEPLPQQDVDSIVVVLCRAGAVRFLRFEAYWCVGRVFL